LQDNIALLIMKTIDYYQSTNHLY